MLLKIDVSRWKRMTASWFAAAEFCRSFTDRECKMQLQGKNDWVMWKKRRGGLNCNVNMSIIHLHPAMIILPTWIQVMRGHDRRCRAVHRRLNYGRWLYIYIHTVYIHVYTCIYMYIYIYIQCIYMYILVYICTYIHAHIYLFLSLTNQISYF